jgi:hypothetical protein
MSSETTGSAEEFHRSQFPGVSICQRQFEPGVWNASLQIQTVLLCCTASFQFFSIILGADSFHLPLAGTVLAGCDGGFAASCVVGQLVARYLPFTAAAAATPPVGVSPAGTAFGWPDDRELSVDLTDAIAWARWHMA